MIKNVRIGIYTYEVIETDKPILIENRLCSAQIDYEKLEILIDSASPEQKKKQSLWHEIVHGIVREWDIDLDNDTEEQKVERLSIGILQVLKDNPEVVI